MSPRHALALALLLQACATSAPMPDATVAIIRAHGTVLDSIDQHNVRDDGPGASARFEIPAGHHEIGVSLANDGAGAAGGDTKVIAVCFGAQAGSTYVAEPIFENGRWRPQITDEASGIAVQRACAAPKPEPDSKPEPAKPASDSNPAATKSASESTTVAAKPEPAPTIAPSTPTERSAPAAAPAPEPTAPESLPVPAAHARVAKDLPGTGVSAGVGFFFGGDTLYSVMFISYPDRKLSAGRGVEISLGGLWTPLWIDDNVGLGVGANLGWKYDSIEASNGTVSLRRFPFSAAAHALFRIDSRWFALVSAGATTELGGHITGTGFAAGATSDLSSTWGLFGDAGLYCRFDHVALGAGVRYVRLHDWFDGAKVNASSFGIVGTGQYLF